MDNCVDCGRVLRDLFCRSCRMIYMRQVRKDMACMNCGQQMIGSASRIRHRCNYCLYHYFDMDHYDPQPEEDLKEYLTSLERDCPECKNRMMINPSNHELVCHTCGLVYEEPIFTKI